MIDLFKYLLFSAFIAVISAINPTIKSALNATFWTTIATAVESAYESTDEVSKCAAIYTTIVTAFWETNKQTLVASVDAAVCSTDIATHWPGIYLDLRPVSFLFDAI